MTTTTTPVSRGVERPAAKLPWRDRAGRFAPFKAAVFAALFLPGLAIAWNLLTHVYVARPITEVIHATGDWAIRLLLVSLAITPLRQILRMPRLNQVRRMIGVAAFAYVCIHLVGFAADKMFDLRAVAAEIVLRLYLTIGLATLLTLLALAATSTDGMMRRIGGKRWQTLHRAVYAAGVLAVAHYAMQSKIDTTAPAIHAGILGWLLVYRVLARRAAPAPVSLLALGILAVVTGVLTALGEAAGFALFTGVDPMLVLQANLMLEPAPRPAAIVGALAGAVVLVRIVVLLAPGVAARLRPLFHLRHRVE